MEKAILFRDGKGQLIELVIRRGGNLFESQSQGFRIYKMWKKSVCYNLRIPGQNLVCNFSCHAICQPVDHLDKGQETEAKAKSHESTKLK